MNSLVSNLRQLMRKHSLSENQLSRNANVPQPTIHRILAGRVADPRDGTLRPIASWFGVTVEQLRTALPEEVAAGGSPYAVDPVTGVMVREKPRDISIPEVRFKPWASQPEPGADITVSIHCHAFPVSWFESHDVAASDIRVMYAEGDSMQRTLFHGDLLAINLADTTITDGRVHVLVTGGPAPSIKVKRLFVLSSGAVRVVCDNPDKSLYPDELLSQTELANIRILARVLDRSGKADL